MFTKNINNDQPTTCLPDIHHGLFTMYVYHNTLHMFTIITLTESLFAHHVYNNHFTICLPYIFTIIALPYAHHGYNNHFTICSPCMFTIIMSPYVHHDLFTMFVYHTHFTIGSSCLFTIVISPHVHFIMDIHSSLYVHHYHFTYYTNLSLISNHNILCVKYVLKCCGKSLSRS